MSTPQEQFDALLSAGGVSVPATELDRLLEEGPAPAAPAPEVRTEEAPASKSKQTLNRENQSLATRVLYLQKVVKVLAAVSGVLAVAAIGVFFWARANEERALEQAFRIIHYREAKACQGNAIVLNDYAQGLRALAKDIQAMDSISDEEKALRIRTVTSTAEQSESLKEGFIRQTKENDRERGSGANFEYRDPFLKKPIKFGEEMGGVINLDKLREEIQHQSKMDDAMRSLREAMLSPIPLQEQVRIEAEKQKAAQAMPGATPKLPTGPGVPGLPNPGQLNLPGAPGAQ